MAKVKLELDSLDPDGLTGKGDAVSAAMTGNANFPAAAALLAKLNADNITAKAKIVAQKNASKAATQTTTDRDAALIVVKQDITAIGSHVQQVSNGNPVIIESAGLSVAAPTHGPIGQLDQVQNLSLTTGDKPGEVDSHWNAVHGRSIYEHQRCIGDPTVEANWQHFATSGASKTTFAGQVSGSKVWFRTRANAPLEANNGAWSQPAGIIVP
jgi:hypothetical protein